jgi:hypothetical protein
MRAAIMSLPVSCRHLITVLCLGLGVATSAGAQEYAPRRHGFWFMIGAGYGSGRIDCDQCNADHDPGLAGTLALGATLSEQFLVGVESDWWSRDDDGVWTSIANVSAVGYFFPRRDMGLFLKAGAGAAGFHSTGFGPDQDHYGVGVIAGLGYELPVNAGLSIVPMASYHWGHIGDDANFTGISQDFFLLGVGVYLP